MDIREDEVLEDLQYNGLALLQKKQGFKFGIDAVILSDFAATKEGAMVADFGTGTGIIPVLLAGKTAAMHITGIEIQKEMAEMAQRSVIINKLEKKIKIISGDYTEASMLLGKSMFDLVVSNPPYIKNGSGIKSSTDMKLCSRHEIFCNLETLIEQASLVLKPMGVFAVIQRPDRITDIIYFMRKYKIEPKIIRPVLPFAGRDANLVLVKGVRDGKEGGAKIITPLIVYKGKGEFSDEINKIYSRT